MRRWIVAAALFTTGDARAQPALSAADVAAGVYRVYAKTVTFEADFEHQTDLKGFGQKKGRGHVAFARAAKLRWDYSMPAGDVVFSDGTILYRYEVSQNTAWQMAPRRSAMPLMLAFVASDLSQDFKLTQLDASQLKFAGYVLKATPKVPVPVASFALFYVTPSFEVVRVLVVDDQDGRQRVDFAKPALNGNLPPTTFQWMPPAGAKVITI